MEVKLTLWNQANGEGLYPVVIRTYIPKTRKPKYQRLGYHIKESDFNRKTGRVSRNCKYADEIHEKFEIEKSKILAQYGFGSAKIKQQTSSYLFSELSEEYIKHLEVDGGKFNTIENFRGVFSNLRAFKTDFDVRNLNSAFIKNFVNHCNNKPYRNKDNELLYKRLSNTTINSYLSRINTFYTWLNKNYSIPDYAEEILPYKELENKQSKGPKYLAIEAIKDLEDQVNNYAILNKDKKFTRLQYMSLVNWLLLYNFAGMRVGDLYRMKFSNIREEQGRLKITLKTKKTTSETNSITINKKATFLLRLFLDGQYLWEYIRNYPEDYLAWFVYDSRKVYTMLPEGTGLFGDTLLKPTDEQIRFVKSLLIAQIKHYGDRFVIPNIPSDLLVGKTQLQIDRKINEINNGHLKRLKKMIGIMELPYAYYHAARHSFAITLIRSKKFSIDAASHALQHGNIQTTSEYVQRFDHEKDMEDIADYLDSI